MGVYDFYKLDIEGKEYEENIVGVIRFSRSSGVLRKLMFMLIEVIMLGIWI